MWSSPDVTVTRPIGGRDVQGEEEVPNQEWTQRWQVAVEKTDKD